MELTRCDGVTSISKRPCPWAENCQRFTRKGEKPLYDFTPGSYSGGKFKCPHFLVHDDWEEKTLGLF